jgi:hypothetical protein
VLIRVKLRGEIPGSPLLIRCEAPS